MKFLNSIINKSAPSSDELPYFFQDPATPVMDGIINLHNYIFFYLVVILVFVLFMIYNILIAYSKNIVRPKRPNHVFFRAEVLKNIGVVHGETLEIIWTVIPSLILVFIAVPSFALLYAMDEIIHPMLTVKAIGYQWYWAYEYSDYTVFKSARKHKAIAFDSYMIDENDLSFGDLRLLEVDNETVLPIKTHIRILLTAVDVLHSWAIPALGVKTDAVPGRMNQLPIFIRREGVFYGQCSELCGVNHGFTPIVVKAVSLKNYYHWINMNYGFKYK